MNKEKDIQELVGKGPGADAPSEQRQRNNRIFLCVVDNTAECKNAVYFAARRVAQTGGASRPSLHNATR